MPDGNPFQQADLQNILKKSRAGKRLTPNEEVLLSKHLDKKPADHDYQKFFKNLVAAQVSTGVEDLV